MRGAQNYPLVSALLLVLMSGVLITPVATAQGGYQPLSRNSLYWLDSASGFTLHPPTTKPTMSQAKAAHAAISWAAVDGATAQIREIGLRRLVQTYQNFPQLTGRTYWVMSLAVHAPGIRFRFYFAVVDARTGRVAHVWYVAQFTRLPRARAPGKIPLVSLPNISAASLGTDLSVLLERPTGTATVSREDALRAARRAPTFARSFPKRGPGRTVTLAYAWSTNIILQNHPLVWVVARPAYRYEAQHRKRFSTYELTFVDAHTGRFDSEFCCAPAIEPF